MRGPRTIVGTSQWPVSPSRSSEQGFLQVPKGSRFLFGCSPETRYSGTIYLEWAVKSFSSRQVISSQRAAGKRFLISTFRRVVLPPTEA